MAFDENKYKSIFEARYGSGSFESGLSQARQIGYSKVQADLAMDQLKKQREKALKKTYQDAIGYWSDPINKESLKKDGAYRRANDILNDPTKQADIEEQGFNVNEYIDGMYYAASDGKYRSQREYGQHQTTAKSQAKSEQKARDEEYKSKYGMSYDEYYQFNKAQQESKKKEQSKKKKNGVNLLDDLKAAGKFAYQGFNPFDDVSMKDAFTEYTERDTSKAFDEVARGSNRTVDSASFGLMSNLDKKVNDRQPYYNSKRDFGDGGGTDMLTSGLGYLVPGAGAYKALNATKLGKGLTQYGAKGVTQRIGSEAAKGAITGAGLAGTEVGVREGLNPQDYTAKQNLGLIGFGTVAGAVADPLLYGLGSAIRKALGKAPAQIADDVLGLPEPQRALPAPQQQALPAPQQLLPEPKPPLRQQFENEGINFGYGSRNAPKARQNLNPVEAPIDPMNRPTDYWAGRYEDFVKHVKDTGYTENNLSRESIEELWTQFAKYDEPVNIEQVVDLAYPKGNVKPPVPETPVVAQPEIPVVQQPVPKQQNIMPELTPTVRASEKTDLLMSLNPSVLKTVRINKDLGKMSKEELQGLATQLSAKQQTVKGKKQLAAVQADLEKVNQFLMKLDLQQFGKSTNINSPQKKSGVTDVTAPNPKDGHGYGLIDLDAEAKAVSKNLENEIKNIKDISQLQVGTKNIYELADRLPKEMGDKIRNSLDSAKTNYVKQLERETKELYETVVQKLKIKSGSKESKLVQDYGEKTLVKGYLRKRGIDPKKLSNEEMERINLQQLKKLHPDKWQKIVEADKYFRQKYDTLIDQVNAVRKQIYPTSPDKIVPKRSDYYHHFNELEGFDGVKNLFDTPSNIDPHLEGVSMYTKPNSKFQGFMQKRGLGPYKSDAVGGFLKYLKASSHSINVDPVIPTLRKTTKTLADVTTDSKNANKIIQSLEMHAGDIAGKTNPYDRLMQLGVGRKGERIVSWVNSRVKGNMILGNLGSVLGQLGGLPLTVGKAKGHILPGVKNTIEQTTRELFKNVDNSAPIYKSQFLKERYADSLFRKFDQRLIDQPKKLAVWMMETTDKAAARTAWNAMYSKGVKEGVKDVVKYADYETRKLIAGRGVGEVPLMQKSKTGQILAPFTLEVGNQWKVLHDMVGAKDAAGILTALIASYGINRVIEQVRGSGVSFDPIDALIDGYTKKDGSSGDKALNAAASLTGEVVGNIPGGNLLTNMVDTDKKVPLTDIQFKELFGERNPNRFGSGLTLGKAITDPLYLLAPFGASQFRKTTQGIDGAINDGVYKGDNSFIPFTGPKTELKYPVDNGIMKDLQLGLMGATSVPEAREYYNQEKRPLSEKQTNILKLIDDPEQKKTYYDMLSKRRQVETIQKKIKDTYKDQSLSESQKRKEVLRLMAELNKINN
jgi:hypothetical protein